MARALFDGRGFEADSADPAKRELMEIVRRHSRRRKILIIRTISNFRFRRINRTSAFTPTVQKTRRSFDESNGFILFYLFVDFVPCIFRFLVLVEHLVDVLRAGTPNDHYHSVIRTFQQTAILVSFERQSCSTRLEIFTNSETEQRTASLHQFHRSRIERVCCHSERRHRLRGWRESTSNGAIEFGVSCQK